MREIRTSGSTRGEGGAPQGVTFSPTLPPLRDIVLSPVAIRMMCSIRFPAETQRTAEKMANQQVHAFTCSMAIARTPFRSTLPLPSAGIAATLRKWSRFGIHSAGSPLASRCRIISAAVTVSLT